MCTNGAYGLIRFVLFLTRAIFPKCQTNTWIHITAVIRPCPIQYICRWIKKFTYKKALWVKPYGSEIAFCCSLFHLPNELHISAVRWGVGLQVCVRSAERWRRHHLLQRGRARQTFQTNTSSERFLWIIILWILNNFFSWRRFTFGFVTKNFHCQYPDPRVFMGPNPNLSFC